MKKSFIALAVALALCLGGVTARAESVGLGEYQGEVIARYLKQEDTIQAPAQGGKAEAELEPGTTIAAEGIPQDQGSLTLVVYPIPAGHDDAWDWFAQCMAPYGTNLYPLDIYFEDEAGKRVELDTAVTITLQTLRDYTDPILCHVASDGTVELLDSRVEGDNITFIVTRGGYYVLAEKAASDDGKPTPTPSATPGVTHGDPCGHSQPHRRTLRHRSPGGCGDRNGVARSVPYTGADRRGDCPDRRREQSGSVGGAALPQRAGAAAWPAVPAEKAVIRPEPFVPAFPAFMESSLLFPAESCVQGENTVK